MNLNQVNLIGRVTKDPEQKTLPSGTVVATFGLATNRVWNNKEGEKKEETEFHNIMTMGKQAETIGKYVVKGQLLYVNGRLQTRSWEAKDGSKRYRTEIFLENFQFGPKAQNSGSSGAVRDEQEEPSTEDISADDIPF